MALTPVAIEPAPTLSEIRDYVNNNLKNSYAAWTFFNSCQTQHEIPRFKAQPVPREPAIIRNLLPHAASAQDSMTAALGANSLYLMAGIVSMNMTRFALLALGIGAGIFVAAVIAGTAFFATHHRSEGASRPRAEAEFERLRARFPDQQPLLDMRDRRAAAKSLHAHPRIRSVHIVIFDTRGAERLVYITVPYRFARLFKGGRDFRYLGELTFLDDTEFDPEPIQLSLDQIERHGPGLLVDYRRSGGGQFIAWAE